MRITEGYSDRNFLYNIDNLNTMLEEASQQVSTGRKIVRLKDSPSGSAEIVGLRGQSADVDQYRTNSDNGTFFIGLSDSVLASVHDILTTIFTKGSQAGSTYNTAASRDALTREIRAERDQLLSLANTQARGRYIFAGSKVTAPPFTLSGDAVTYQGDSEVNQIQVGDKLNVQVGIAGDSVFTPVFNTIAGLLTALDGNDQAAIKQSLEQFTAGLGAVNVSRTVLGLDLSRLESVKTELDEKDSMVRSRRSRLEDANMAEAITRLDRIQTALKATMTSQAVIDRKSLLDYLG